MLTDNFFNQDAQELAKALLGKVLCVKYQDEWLKAIIIETEAYYLTDKASHSGLGFTPKRRALFMPAGTIYMYYSRGRDSLNFSAQGEGNAVLIKSGFPFDNSKTALELMQQLTPNKPIEKMCAGQTLLCQSLNLKVKDWDQKNFDSQFFYVTDVGYRPEKIIQTTRLGIAPHRDADLPYRFIDHAYAKNCTSNPLRKRVIENGGVEII